MTAASRLTAADRREDGRILGGGRGRLVLKVKFLLTVAI